MKYFLSIFFLAFCLNHLSAQEKHFIFIQSDTKQPFYVSVNGKLFSSTASGYVIIPKLADGNYNLTVGFAQNTFPEQTFTCVIQNKDLGFDLKNLNEKGWALFNLQTLDLTMASSANTNVVAKALIESSNAKAPPPVISFDKKKDTTQVVAKPVEVALNEVAKSEDVKEPVSIQDQSLGANVKNATETVATIDETTKSGGAGTNKSKPSDVKKLSEVTDEGGVHLSYVEGSGRTRDTINVIIPSSTDPSGSSNGTSSATSADLSKNSTATSNQASTGSSTPSEKSDLKFLDFKMGAQKDSVQVSSIVTEGRRIMENSNCKNIATDDDYSRLRKKMAMETSDDKMISEAKKFYRNKCFTTSQIKALSTLFLSDEGRFKFFDASFVSVADAAQYSSLQTEFIDPAYRDRFKSLLQ